MGPFDSVQNARSCDVDFKEEEKLSQKYVLSIGVVRVSVCGMLLFVRLVTF